MKQELIFIWINDYGCLKKTGFNFSPRFRVSFDELRRELTICKTKDINIFQVENILNVTAVIGENGSGKTTLLQFLNSLLATPFQQTDDVAYAQHIKEQNDHGAFVALYFINGEATVLNKTKHSIFFQEKEIPPISQEDFIERDPLRNTTHIYFTNSEYATDSNLYQRDIDHISIFNAAMTSVMRNFYQYTVWHEAPPTAKGFFDFYEFQNLLIQRKTVQDFQQILDVLFLYRMKLRHLESEYLGKRIADVQVFLSSPLVVMQKYFSIYGIPKPLKNPWDRLTRSHIFKTIKEKSSLADRLVHNLAVELCILYDFDCENPYTDEILRTASEFINRIEDCAARRYYQVAVNEIKRFNNLTKKIAISCHSLPQNDLAYAEWYSIPVSKLGAFFAKWQNTDCLSFIAKYISIEGLSLSSGERALLNFSSRIEMLNYLSRLSGRTMYRPRENILFLFDEIDLYVHPNAQKKLIFSLLCQVKKLFKGHNVQIVLSSHSPIVLSDIPSANTIYLFQGDNGITRVRDGQTVRQTFAANIPSLYRNSFFIEDGIGIGDYALDRINRVSKTILGDESFDNEKITYCRAIISLIGEPILKGQLEEMFEKKVGRSIPERASTKPTKEIPDAERESYIKFLKQQLSLIEREILRIEGKADD